MANFGLGIVMHSNTEDGRANFYDVNKFVRETCLASNLMLINDCSNPIHCMFSSIYEPECALGWPFAPLCFARKN
jgi:hypothetical protein